MFFNNTISKEFFSQLNNITLYNLYGCIWKNAFLTSSSSIGSNNTSYFVLEILFSTQCVTSSQFVFDALKSSEKYVIMIFCNLKSHPTSWPSSLRSDMFNYSSVYFLLLRENIYCFDLLHEAIIA